MSYIISVSAWYGYKYKWYCCNSVKLVSCNPSLLTTEWLSISPSGETCSMVTIGYTIVIKSVKLSIVSD